MKKAKYLFLFLLTSITHMAAGQSLYVTMDQELQFGSFYLAGGSIGTLSVSDSGGRQTTGNVQAVSSNYQPGALTVSTDSSTSVNVQITSDPAVLTNPNGDNIQLDAIISDSEVSVQQGLPVQVYIGGILTVEQEISPGNYSGEVIVTFSIHNE